MRKQWSLGLIGISVLVLAACDSGLSEAPEAPVLEPQAYGALIWPSTGSANSEIAMRTHPISGVKKQHRGRDIAAPTGTAIYAAYDGTITCACFEASGAGNYIKISHASGYETLYMHMSKFERTSGTVKKGDLIGRVGSTGGSTGPHLHFEVRRNGTFIDWDNSILYGTKVTAKTAVPYDFASLAAGGTVTPPPTCTRTWPTVQRSTTYSSNAKAVQHLLKSRGYSLTVDGYFGSGTESTVKSFQSSKGLSADGIVGKNTWEKLIVTVQQGSQGDAVRAVQTKLGISADGIFGSGTKTAVITFQKTKGLGADGIVGVNTWAALMGGKGCS